MTMARFEGKGYESQILIDQLLQDHPGIINLALKRVYDVPMLAIHHEWGRGVESRGQRLGLQTYMRRDKHL
jgi:hypothetical protein